VSRHLIVSDLQRSTAFYGDVLGFEIRSSAPGHELATAAEAIRGPARIFLVMRKGAPDPAQQLQPGGSTIVWFQAENVAAFRDDLVAHGGRPGELEKVNWIKMRMFEIRDPDGHTLWFGESFDEPDRPAPPHMLKTIMPELPFDDVGAGVAHYRDVLGFHANYVQHDFAVMDRDNVRVLFVARSERHKGIGSCYVYVENADALHAELRAKGAKVLGEPVSQPWGLREFRVLDIEGNQITFGQPFE
jgi:uncharacterized glyoxalase superfamily protein PhnB